MRPVGALEPDTIRAFLSELVETDRPERRPTSFDTVVDELGGAGIEPGNPVLVAMPNGGPFVTVLLALLARGAVPVLLPSAAPPSRIERMGRALGANVLVAPRIPAELRDGAPTHTIADEARLARLTGLETQDYRPGEIILLTSGTSGVFSGCLHRLDALLRNATRHAAAIGQTGTDRVLINLPMHYSYAFVAQLLATLVTGGTAVITGPPFTPARYESILREHTVTLSSLTPPLMVAWRRTGRRLPVSLRALTVGGGALDALSVADVLKRNPGLELYLTYGLTEAGPRVSTLAAHREPAHRHASVGLPLSGVRVSLRPENPQDTAGELIVETDTAMLRRVGRRDVLTDGTGAAVATGDLFERDDDGYLYFRGRRPTYVISRGEKVSLRSVCEAAESIPGVTGAEAWTHEDADGDSVFTLDVYCRDDSLGEQDIRRHLARVLLRSEQPARLLVHPASHPGWRKSATP